LIDRGRIRRRVMKVRPMIARPHDIPMSSARNVMTQFAASMSGCRMFAT
jgi:hypothetical protein